MKIGLQRVYRIILTVVTLSTGIVVLLSFAFPNEALRTLRGLFVEWTVIVIAFSMILGVMNVLRVHAQRIQGGKGVLYSGIVVISFLAVFVPGILISEQLPAALRDPLGDHVGPRGTIVDFAYRYVQRPLQATLFSLMAFFCFTAAWRAFRIRSAASFVMFIAALLVLLGSLKLSLGSDWTLFTETRNWIMNVPVMAGARGMLLGIVLGTVVAGMRLLLGLDRPYSD